MATLGGARRRGRRRSGAGLVLCTLGALLALAPDARAATVTLRSDGQYATDPGNWTWGGTELGDNSDASYATTNKANRTARSSVENNAIYAGCTINSVNVYARIGQTNGNELFDYGLYNPGDTLDYNTGSPVTPPGSSFTTYNNLWSTRPWGGAWTATDVDGLVITGTSAASGKFDGELRWADTWAVVDYTCAGDTTTLGDGADPGANPTVCPGASGVVLDRFSFVTSGNSDQVNNVTVNFNAATYVAQVDVTSVGGGTTYGAQTNPGDPQIVDLTGGSVLTATGSSADYELRVDVDGHGALPAPPGAEYTLTGVVSDFTPASNSKAGSDPNGDTVTIDNLSPGTPTGPSCTPQSANQIQVGWSSGDSVIVVRRAGAAPTFAPTEGATYNLSDEVVSGEFVVYKGSSPPQSDSGLNQSTHYFYEIWAYDACLNYAAAPLATDCTTPSGNSAPSFTGTQANDGVRTPATSLSTCSGRDVTITSTVNDADGDPVDWEIFTSTGAFTSCASASGQTQPAAAQCDIINIAADTDYYVWAQDDSLAQATDPAGAPGSFHSITLDLSAPGGASFTGCSGTSPSAIQLAWTNPGDGDFQEVLVVRGPDNQGTCPSFAPANGSSYGVGAQGADQIIYVGSVSPQSDSGLSEGDTYCYEIWSGDDCHNWVASPGSTSCGTQTNSVTPQVASAVVDACDQITVSAPFSGDQNGSSSTSFERGPSATGPWTAACSGVTGPSPRSCVDGVSPLSSYHYRVTFTDGDGVSAAIVPDPQIIGPYATGECSVPGTTVGVASALADSCSQITVTAVHTGDTDADGWVLVEYDDGGWQTGCASLSGASPRQCMIAGLTASTAYALRVTYNDPDGVTPDNNGGASDEQVTPTGSPVSTPACGGDQVPPIVLVQSPARDALLGGTDKVKVEVYEAVALAVTDPVKWAVDGAALTNVASVNANYSCGTGCAVYEFDLDTTVLSDDSHYFTIEASDDAGNVTTRSHGFRVKNDAGQPVGDGTLLRRAHGSQLCIDCHALQGHGSRKSRKYGTWAVGCLDCHTPHNTRNIYLIREQIRTPNSGVLDVRFANKTGASNDSVDWASASYVNEDNDTVGVDGVCQVCHTRTGGAIARWRNGDSGGHSGGHYGSASTKPCTECHVHAEGFSGGACNGCHEAPPSIGEHGLHDEVPADVASLSYEELAGHATPTQYGFACGKCHAGLHMNDAVHSGASGDPYLVEVAFDDTTAPANPSGSYAGTYNQNQQFYADPPYGDEYWSWSDGTCSNLYCHSNAAPLGVGASDTSAAPTWSTDATACNSCHDTRGRTESGVAEDVSALSTAHGAHIKWDSGESSTYSFRCDECHADTVKDNPNDPWLLVRADFSSVAGGGKVLHVNGTKDWKFSATATASNSVDQSGGGYAGGGGACSNIYCHSRGYSDVAPFPAPFDAALAWVGGSSGCDSCHGGNASASNTMTSSSPSTNAHGAHMEQSAYLGVNLGCAECHSQTVAAGNDAQLHATTGYAQHVDGTIDVAMAQGGAWTEPSCASVYCHSDGTETVGYANPPTWTAGTALTNDCKQCHGRSSSQAGEPDYPNNTGSADTRNSHAAHVWSGADTRACAPCHESTVLASGGLKGSPSLHLDGDADVVGGGCNITGYDPVAETGCTNACHDNSGAPVAWGGSPSLSCRDCHNTNTNGDAAADDVDSYTWDWDCGAGSIAKVDSYEWATYGHGLPAASQYPETYDSALKDGSFKVNSGAGFDDGARDGCVYCHDDTVGHNDPSNPFRLANVGAGVTVADKNGVCLVCHGAAADPGYDGNLGGGNSIDSPLDVETAHYGYSHLDNDLGAPWGKHGGAYCWDCHDPHGDYDYGNGRVFSAMFQREPTADHSGTDGATKWGVPTTSADTPNFNIATDGAGTTWDWDDYALSAPVLGTYRGVCQVCHSANNKFNNASWSSTETDHFSTKPGCGAGPECHSHRNNFNQKACNECHQAPPRPGGSGTNNWTNPNDRHKDHIERDPLSDPAALPTTFDEVASKATPTQYAFACAKCHSSDTNAKPAPVTHFNEVNTGASGDGFPAEVGFDTTQGPANNAGDYTFEAYATRAEDNTLTDGRYWTWSDTTANTGGDDPGECKNLYCHSNGAPVGATNSFATGYFWASPDGALGCDGCHAVSGDAGTGAALSKAHQRHANGGAHYAFKCDECHAETMKDNPALAASMSQADFSTAAGGGKVKHVDGVKDWWFSTTATAADSIDQSGGDFTAGVCNNTYCHSQGKITVGPFDGAGDAPNLDPVWHTGTATCDTCHGGNAAATFKMSSFAHGAHVDNVAYLGEDVPCFRCHDDTVVDTADTQIRTLSVHVNGARDTKLVHDDRSAAGSYAAAGNGTCASAYCHSDGTETPGWPQAAGNFEWKTDTLADDCRGCHGTEGGSLGGEPMYANNTGSVDTRNSHASAAHVSNAGAAQALADCYKCHELTTSSGGSLISGGYHMDQVGTVQFPSGIDLTPGNKTDDYDEATETCSNVACHGGNDAQWGQQDLSCADCHLTAANATSGDGDTDDYAFPGDWSGTASALDGDDWAAFGHGRASTFAESGNAAASFDSGGQDGCLYCHDPGVPHNDGSAGANFFRLRNVTVGGTVKQKNQVCLQCHETGAAAYGSAIGLADVNPSARVGAWHYGADHTTSPTGVSGMFCWDCHDPHGDYNSAASQNLAYMIQEEPVGNHAGSGGWGIPVNNATFTGGLATTPDFRNNRDGTGAAGGGAGRDWNWGDYVSSSLDSGTYRGVCQVCHTDTTNLARYYRDSGYEAGHYNTSGRCSTAACHPHEQPDVDAFKPSGGGDCLGCHAQGTGSGATARREIVGASNHDFDGRNSHHVGARYDSAGADLDTGQTNMGGWLTNFDCIVCHAEGYVSWNAGEGKWEPGTSTTWHGNDGGSKSIDLRDVDQNTLETQNAAASAVFVYDKEASGMPSKATPADWASDSTEWRVQSSGCASPANGGCTPAAGKGLDPFCLSCHDANGASAASAGYTGGHSALDNPHSNAGASNPFGDLKITNENDQWDRGSVVDVKSRVSGSPPPQGQYSRHAIRGQSTSRYTAYTLANNTDCLNGKGAGIRCGTMYDTYDVKGNSTGNMFTSLGASTNNGPLWNDTSVMSCADCHTTDGANGTAGNAHGADGEYLLKDSDGLATEAQTKYVCYLCHARARYEDGSGDKHTGSDSDYSDYTANTGTGPNAGRVPEANDGGNIFGTSCANCHGGVVDTTTDGTGDLEFGTIHGTSQVMDNGAGGTFNAYRFNNGNSLRFIDPNGWNTEETTCYTLTSGDEFGGCIKHGTGTGRSRAMIRKLNY